MPKGAGIWDAGRKLLNRIDRLEAEVKSHTGQSFQSTNSRKIRALKQDVERLSRTKYLSTFEFDNIQKEAQASADDFEKMRVVVRGIQIAARNAPKTIDGALDVALIAH